MSFGSVLRSARAQPQILWSGATPALLSVLSGVAADHVMFRELRKRAENMNGNESTKQVAMVMVTVASSLMGAILSEPFKMVSKRMAVESTRAASCASLRGTVEKLMQGGVGEFWRGFPHKGLRYGVSAFVSKTAVQRLRDVPQASERPILIDKVACVTLERRALTEARGGKKVLDRIKRHGKELQYAS